MKRYIAALALLPLVACASSAPPPRPYVERDGKPYQFTADPGALVAVDIAFQRAVREDGFAKASKDFAAKDAQIIGRGRLPLNTFLNNGEYPASYVKTDTKSVVMSCDGRSAAVSTAGVSASGQLWALLTIWNKTAKGEWRWSLMTMANWEDGNVPTGTAVETFVAKCGTRPAAAITAPAEGVDMQVGYSPDQTLSWTSIIKPDKMPDVTVTMWDGTSMVQMGRLFGY